MTSLAFILGVLPLMVSYGAGAEMRKTLGTTVFSGMLGVTIFGVFLTPVFFFVIEGLGETRFFRNPVLRKVSDSVLGLLSLRFLRRPSRTRRPAPAPAHRMPAPAPGELVEHK